MIILLTVAGGLFVITRFDSSFPWWGFSRRGKERTLALGTLCCVNAIIAGFFAASVGKVQIYPAICLFAGCLLLASITDCLIFQVYNFVWWLAAGAVLWMMICTKESGSIVSCLLFFGLQQFFFSRMYGRADCHAFSACAMVQCALGMGMIAYLLHMLIAYFLLTVVQVIRGNVNSRGNLKEEVAFLPYITISFWIFLLLGLCDFLPKMRGMMHVN